MSSRLFYVCFGRSRNFSHFSFTSLKNHRFFKIRSSGCVWGIEVVFKKKNMEPVNIRCDAGAACFCLNHIEKSDICVYVNVSRQAADVCLQATFITAAQGRTQSNTNPALNLETVTEIEICGFLCYFNHLRLLRCFKKRFLWGLIRHLPGITITGTHELLLVGLLFGSCFIQLRFFVRFLKAKEKPFYCCSLRNCNWLHLLVWCTLR